MRGLFEGQHPRDDVDDRVRPPRTRRLDLVRLAWPRSAARPSTAGRSTCRRRSAAELPLPDLAAEQRARGDRDPVRHGERVGHPAHRRRSSDKLVYVWTSFEPDAARRVWACFDQPDLKAPHGSPSSPTRPGRSPATARPTRSRTTPTVAAGGRSPTHRHCRRTSWWSTPARSTRSGSSAAATASASTAGSRCGRSSSGTPRSCSPSPRRGWSSSASGSASRSHRSATTTCSCPTWAAPWRTGAVSPGATPRSTAVSRRRASGPGGRPCCCTRWRTCGSATW